MVLAQAVGACDHGRMRVGNLCLLIVALAICLLDSRTVVAQVPDSVQRISAADLVKVMQGSGPKPLIFQVGPQRLFRYAHVRGAEYVGAASEPAGIAALDKRVKGLKKSTAIVIYCGCCPWVHCPNVGPAYAELTKLGFKNVKALYLPSNFKFDWEDKGYPTERGE